MKDIDKLSEGLVRGLARLNSRRGVLATIGGIPMFYLGDEIATINDHSYEEEGQDYPYGYVRWTENRNMTAFVKLLKDGAVDVRGLTSHVIDIHFP